MAKGDGAHRVVQMVEENAYKIELLGNMNISSPLVLETSHHTLRMKMREIKISRQILFKEGR